MSRIQAVHPVLPARDVEASIAFYVGLGFELPFQDDSEHPSYAGVARDGAQVHLQWADAEQYAHPGDRPSCRFLVDDVDALYAHFIATGLPAAELRPGSPYAAPADTPWGTREFHLRDPGQNSLQFYRPR